MMVEKTFFEALIGIEIAKMTYDMFMDARKTSNLRSQGLARQTSLGVKAIKMKGVSPMIMNSVNRVYGRRKC